MKICLACDHRFESADWCCPHCLGVPSQHEGTFMFAPSLANGNGGFREEHFGDLAKLEAAHFWFRNRNRLLIWSLRTFFPDTRSFLEIGCGTGFVLNGIRQALPQIELSGSELFMRGLQFARERLPNVSLHQMDARQIPFEREFDVVGAFDVLEHIEEDAAALRQFHQAVKPGGGLLLSVPQHPSLWSAADVAACHQRRYTRDELVDKVRAAGFKPLWVSSFVSLLLPLMWISRSRSCQGRSVSENDEFRMNRAANSMLEGVLSFERWLIQLGARFPAGGSLLLAAQRLPA